MVIPPNPNPNPHDFNDASDWTPWQRRHRGAPSLAEVERRATEALRQRGYDASGLKLDGSVFRFPVEGDSGAQKTGWGIVFADEWASMVFGNWREGEKEVVPLYDESRPLSLEERHARDEAFKRHKEAAAEARRMTAEKAAEEAYGKWLKAPDAGDDFGYLKAKGVRCPAGVKLLPCWHGGVKALRDALLVPLCDASGTFKSCQRIFADGFKAHYSNAEAKGAFFEIAGRDSSPASPAIVCEGMATGATIAEAWPSARVICVCTCNNLLPVCEALRDAGRTPALILYDNDWAKAQERYAKAVKDGSAGGRTVDDFNAGKHEATKAARAVQCRCAPAVPDGFAGTDANDLYMAERRKGLEAGLGEAEARARGLEAVRDAVAKGFEPTAQSAPSAFDALDELDRYAPGHGVYEGPPPPFDWLFDCLIEQGNIGVVAGPGGAGKSTAMTQAVFSAATGRPWLGMWPVCGEPGGAWYLSSEDTRRDLARRQEAIMNTLTTDEKRLATQNVRLVPLTGRTSLFRQDAKTGAVSLDNGWPKFRDAVLSWRPRLVVLDPFSAVALANENDNTAMTDILQELEGLARESNAVIMYLHHVAKAGRVVQDKHEDLVAAMTHGSIRGAGAIVNRPRLAMLMYPLSVKLAQQCVEEGQPFKDGQVVAFKDVKKNGAPLGPMRYFSHTPACGLFEPLTAVKDDVERKNDKVALKRAEDAKDLDRLAVALAQEAVLREQTPGMSRVAVSYVVEAIHAGGHSVGRSGSIAFRAESLGLVWQVDYGMLVEAGFAPKRAGRVGKMVVPTVRSFSRYGDSDPDRPGEFLRVPAEFRRWVEGLEKTLCRPQADAEASAEKGADNPPEPAPQGFEEGSQGTGEN